MGNITIPNEFYEAMSKIKEDGNFYKLTECEKDVVRRSVLVKICTEPKKMDELIAEVREYIMNKEKK